MTIRSQNYFVYPLSARPATVTQPPGSIELRVDLGTSDIARCAWAETLQTAPRATSLIAFFDDLLAPGSELIWKESGPGRGTEMRRAYSGMLGRFLARAYLESHHGFTWFAAIDGDNFHFDPKWRVRRKPNSRTEMPDWICAADATAASSGQVAVAEAKGSHQKGKASAHKLPSPLDTALGQLGGVNVQGLTRGGRWQTKIVKGWAVMSRWGTQSPPRDPYLYVADPDSDGEVLTDEENDQLIQAVARAHISQLAEGLGLLLPERDFKPPLRSRMLRLNSALGERTLVGSFISPFGLVDLDLAGAETLMRTLPDRNLLRFVGLEEHTYLNFINGKQIVSIEPTRLGASSWVGRDGFATVSADDAATGGRVTEVDPM